MGLAGGKTAATDTPPLSEQRLFWEDIPFGLCILRALAGMMSVPTPCIDDHIRWHQQFMGTTFLREDGTLDQDTLPSTGAPQAYGIHSLDQVVASALPRGAATAQSKPQARL